MSNVVDIPLGSNDPHGHGEAFCLGCGHEWQAVVPLGTTRLECPKCHSMKGLLKFEFIPEEMWECGCGNRLFYITSDGHVCANCGAEQNY